MLKNINKNSTANVIFNGKRANAFLLNIEIKRRISNLRSSIQYCSEDLSYHKNTGGKKSIQIRKDEISISLLVDDMIVIEDPKESTKTWLTTRDFSKVTIKKVNK